MDKQIEELEDINYSEITYNGNDLKYYENIFTIKLPQLPCNQYEIQNKIIDAGNAYQNVYNIYSNVQLLCYEAEKVYKDEKYRLVSIYVENCTKKGVKPPGKEQCEIIVMNNKDNTKLKAMMERYKIYERIKEFFNDHRKKLENILDVLKGFNYSVNQSTRVEYRG